MLCCAVHFFPYATMYTYLKNVQGEVWPFFEPACYSLQLLGEGGHIHCCWNNYPRDSHPFLHCQPNWKANRYDSFRWIILNNFSFKLGIFHTSELIFYTDLQRNYYIFRYFLKFFSLFRFFVCTPPSRCLLYNTVLLCFLCKLVLPTLFAYRTCLHTGTSLYRMLPYLNWLIDEKATVRGTLN